jgi:hypothetical protein
VPQLMGVGQDDGLLLKDGRRDKEPVHALPKRGRLSGAHNESYPVSLG